MIRLTLLVTTLLGTGILVTIVRGQEDRGNRSQDQRPIRSVLRRPGDSETRSVADTPSPGLPTAVAPRGLANQPPRGGEVASPRSTAPQEIAAPRPQPAAPAYTRPVTGVTTGTALQVSSAAPNVTVSALGPAAIQAGKPAEYTIEVANEGNEAASNLIVRIALPAWVSIDRLEPTAGVTERLEDEGSVVAWTISPLQPQRTEAMKLTLTPQANEPFSPQIDWAIRSSTASFQVVVQQPRLEIQIEGPDDMMFGNSEIYEIRVSNPGNGPAENVLLSLITGAAGRAVSKPIGTIEAGGEEVVRIELIAREPGDLNIQATVSSDDLQAQRQRLISVRSPQIEIDIQGPPVKYAKTEGGYRLTVQNRGDAVAENVIVNTYLPAGCEFLGGVQARQEGNLLQWQIPQLGPGQSQSFTFQCLFDAAGDQQLRVVAESAGREATRQFVTRVEAIADLKMMVHDPRGPRPVGEQVVYEVEIVNRGSKVATNVQLIGQFSDGIEPSQADGHPARLVPGQVLYQPIPRIEPGRTITLRITAAATAAGNHRFRAVLTCEDPDTELSAEDMTRYFSAEYLGTSIP